MSVVLDSVMSEFDRAIQRIFAQSEEDGLEEENRDSRSPLDHSLINDAKISPTAALMASPYYASSPYAFPCFDKPKKSPTTTEPAEKKPTTQPHYCAKWRKYQALGTDANGRPLRIRHYCAVKNCTVNEYSVKEGGDKFHFFRVPQKDLERRTVWVRILRPEDPFWDPALGSRVCERHFEDGNPGRFGFPTLNLDSGDGARPQTPNCGCKIGGKKGKKKKTVDGDAPTMVTAEPQPLPELSASSQAASTPSLPESSSQSLAQDSPGVPADTDEDLAIPSDSDSPTPPPAKQKIKQQNGKSKDGIVVKAEDVEVVAGRVSSFRSTIQLLEAQLKADENLLAKISPGHPLLPAGEVREVAETPEVPTRELEPKAPSQSPKKSPKAKAKPAVASPPESEGGNGRTSRSKAKRQISEEKVEEDVKEEPKRRRSSSRINSRK